MTTVENLLSAFGIRRFGYRDGVRSSERILRHTITDRPWMANPLGAMQGGVVAAIISQACSFAGQLSAGPGQQYALVDLTASFWRSPPVDIGEITVTTMLDKLGRRIGTASATMTGPDDVPLAHAVADIQYGRATRPGR
ncbi:MAG TPA: PaaI family thioesterase [Mycobacterium sp.]|nr:PaaI family thioesterase [Mycobacterium sp.]